MTTITQKNDIVVNMTSAQLDGRWNSDLDDGERATFDPESLPDDVETGERVYFEAEGAMYAEATVHEVTEDAVKTSGVVGLHVAADCPVDVPTDGYARLSEGGIPPESSHNVSSDTVVDAEEWR